MSRGLVVRLLVCLSFFCLCLFLSINQQNTITRLRLEIPQTMKLLREVEAENSALQFDIASLEQPHRLLEAAKQPCFAHLHYPTQDQVMTVP
ncbi:MAG: hypothetical protein JSS62_00835 [Verrucomicrobia bacterium]|nr:hypothetical protein [Verrucomicrobiota bacterium]MBS0645233.1 hypothetical protein [Verrucomicrobiota bacterium]